MIAGSFSLRPIVKILIYRFIISLSVTGSNPFPHQKFTELMYVKGVSVGKTHPI